MSDLTWSGSEKKTARRAFEAARSRKFAQVMAEFKTKAAAVTTADEMWEVESFLREQRREIDDIFDYRYSQLPIVFARLIHAGLLDEAELIGLSEDKLTVIRRFISFKREQESNADA